MNKLKSWLITWLTKDVDLIYTSKGNLPVKSLRYETSWHFSLGQIELNEKYYLGDEIVKDGLHVFKLAEETSLYIKTGKLNQPKKVNKPLAFY
jgi:hypothetical protein